MQNILRFKRIGFILAIAGSLLLGNLIALAATSGQQLWVKRYNGPTNYGDSSDAMAIDKNNNIYVAGVSDGNATLIKYNSLGNRKWIRHYASYRINAISVDKNNNIYVAGDSYKNEAAGLDYTTIKYDSSGNRKWIKRYGKLTNSDPLKNDEQVTAMTIDSNNNIYVTGESDGEVDEYGVGIDDYATVKYDSAGRQKWVKRYNGQKMGRDVATAIVADSNNNVYVTGYSWRDATDFDIITIKYSAAGLQKWVKRFNGSANGGDAAFAMAIDLNNNIYVTGESWNGLTDDIITIKYSTSGSRKWIKRYDKGFGDTARAITVDKNGNSYVVGRSIGVYGPTKTTFDFVTIKYGPLGGQKWAKRYAYADRNDYATDIAVDQIGNVFVTGYSEALHYIVAGKTDFDFVTIKYGPLGGQKWVKRYGAVAYNSTFGSDDKANVIALDSSGNVYVTGTSYGGSSSFDDFATIKYAP